MKDEEYEIDLKELVKQLEDTKIKIEPDKFVIKADKKGVRLKGKFPDIMFGLSNISQAIMENLEEVGVPRELCIKIITHTVATAINLHDLKHRNKEE